MPVRLETLEDLLRVVQDGGRRVHLQRAVLLDAPVRPAGLLRVRDAGHVFGEHGAELRRGEGGLALGVGDGRVRPRDLEEVGGRGCCEGAHVRGPFTRVGNDGTGEDGRVDRRQAPRRAGLSPRCARRGPCPPRPSTVLARRSPRSAMSSATAFSTEAAASVSPRCSSSSATDSTVAVGSALPWPAMSGRRAVHRLEHARRGAVRVDVGRRGQADAARDRRRQVREDVAEQVVGDDHVEPRRVGDQEDRRRVHVQVVDRHVGELGVHGLDRAAPQVAGVHEHVVLVHQRQLLARTGGGTGERVADHTLDTERGVHADLVGHLVRRAHADGAAVADVRTLGALADDHEVDLARVAERRRDARVQAARAQVHVVVQREAQLEQQPALEHARGDARVADGAQQDRVVRADRVEVGVRQRLAGRVPAARAQVEVRRRHRDRAAVQRGVQRQQTLLDDLRADAVPCDDGEVDVLGSGGVDHASSLTRVPPFGTGVSDLGRSALSRRRASDRSSGR